MTIVTLASFGTILGIEGAPASMLLALVVMHVVAGAAAYAVTDRRGTACALTVPGHAGPTSDRQRLEVWREDADSSIMSVWSLHGTTTTWRCAGCTTAWHRHTGGWR